MSKKNSIMEQELESQFAELQEEVDSMISEDTKDSERGPPRLRPTINADLCLATHCEVKENNSKLELRVKELKARNGKIFREAELLRATLKGSVSDDEKREAVTNAVRDEFVQSLNDEAKKLRDEVNGREAIIRGLRSEVDSLRKAKEDYEGLLRTDQKLAEKWRRLRLLEERCAQMDAWYREAYVNAQKLNSNVEKQRNELSALTRQRDETKAEYVEAKELLVHADKLLRKGFEVVPPKKPFFRNPFKRGAAVSPKSRYDIPSLDV